MRAILSLTVAVAIAGILPGQSQRVELDAEVRERLTEALGKVNSDTMLRRLASDRMDEREAAAAQFETLRQVAPRDLVALAMAGMWSTDPKVATGACSLLEWHNLSLTESARYLEVGASDVFRRNPVIDFEKYRLVLGSSSIEALMEEEPARDREVHEIFDLIRLQLRAEHVPLLCRYMTCDQSMLRHGALKNLGIVTRYTNRYRETIGLSLLAWPMDEVRSPDDEPPDNYTAREFELPKQRNGYPVVLHAALRRLFLEPVDDGLDAMRNWARRWAFDARAGEADRDLLIELAGSEHAFAQQIAARGLQHLDDASSTEVLRRMTAPSTRTDKTARRFAECAMALRGDREAAATLKAKIDIDPVAHALWLNVDSAAVSALCHVACGPNSNAGKAQISRIQRLIHASYELDIALPERLGTELERAASSSRDIDVSRIRQLLMSVPECRTERLIRIYFERFDARHIPRLRAQVCEVLDPQGLCAKLRSSIDHDDPGVREVTLELLVKLGDPESAEAILDHCLDSEPPPWFELSRTKCEAVRTLLLERARGFELPATGAIERAAIEPLFALAAHDGLPEDTARGWCAQLADNEADTIRPRFAAWRERILAGKPLQALAIQLEDYPDELGIIDGLGLVQDPRVLDFLHEHRRRPGTNVCQVIGELAVAGDRDAIQELRGALEAGHQGWLDNASVHVLTIGDDPATLAFWVRELETNGSRVVIAESALRRMLGIRAAFLKDSFCRTKAEIVGDLVTRFAAGIRWSRIAGHWVATKP